VENDKDNSWDNDKDNKWDNDKDNSWDNDKDNSWDDDKDNSWDDDKDNSWDDDKWDDDKWDDDKWDDDKWDDDKWDDDKWDDDKWDDDKWDDDKHKNENSTDWDWDWDWENENSTDWDDGDDWEEDEEEMRKLGPLILVRQFYMAEQGEDLEVKFVVAGKLPLVARNVSLSGCNNTATNFDVKLNVTVNGTIPNDYGFEYTMPYVVYGSATLNNVTCDDKGLFRIAYNKMGGDDMKLMKGRFAVIVKGCRGGDKDDMDDKDWGDMDDDKDWDNMDDDKSDKKDDYMRDF